MTRALINQLYQHKWVVYAKQNFSGPQSVIKYLGRYTYKIAISNHRITNAESGKVTFSYKDCKHGDIKKEMSLEAMEFIRRFSLHIMPKGFVRIRHYGIRSSAKFGSAVMIKAQLPKSKPVTAPINKVGPEPFNPKQCPCCKKETMKQLCNSKGVVHQQTGKNWPCHYWNESSLLQAVFVK